jgi:hypothetical protein
MFNLRVLYLLGLFVLTYAGLSLLFPSREQSPFMADRKDVTYTFQGADEYERQNGTVNSIIKEDTGIESWRMNRMLPPTCHPPPLTIGAIDKLKGLDGVIVNEVAEEKAEV